MSEKVRVKIENPCHVDSIPRAKGDSVVVAREVGESLAAAGYGKVAGLATEEEAVDHLAATRETAAKKRAESRKAAKAKAKGKGTESK